MTKLRGITWNHTRGFLPMVATAQRFAELHPDTEIHWEKRSLQQFADWSVERLAGEYDLLVIDHPSIGEAVARGALLPLEEHLPASFLADQAASSAGLSHTSYSWHGHQWALAIDAAAPVCGFRPDLLERAGARLPSSWDELLELARHGLVDIPGDAIDSLMTFYMLCGALGESPFLDECRVVREDIFLQALAMLRDLVHACGPECLSRNPIAVWERLSREDTAALCPFAYGYSNYARPGYSRRILEFGGLLANFRSTLGGAGLAVSARCAHRAPALRYCEYAAGPECQRTVYFDSGGQPGHRAAWMDGEVNRRCESYFIHTLETLDRAYLRPRYDGYLAFQSAAGAALHGFLLGRSAAGEAVREIDRIYKESRYHHATA